MRDNEVDVDRLMRHIEAKIDLARAARGLDFNYWASLPLCIIDSVFSIRAKYSGVERVVIKWCESQKPPWEWKTGFKPATDTGPTVRDFVDVIESCLAGGCKYEELFGNKQRTSPRGGILKAEAVHRFANALLNSGINTFSDVRDHGKLEAAEKRVKEIPGQRSGITFKYFLMLAGEDSFVKPDTHLRRFVSDALCIDWSCLVPEGRTEELVREAARRFEKDHPRLTPVALDYAIWSYQKTQN